MSNTPEGKVKDKVKSLFLRYGVYAHMSVTQGYGKATLDFIACSKGRFFAVETKRTGKKMTERQERIAAMIRAAGGIVFVVDGPPGLGELEAWLQAA
jgi:penicillin-binding protein-related factor A (putative recombinase)